MDRKERIAYLNEGYRRWQLSRDNAGIPTTQSKPRHFAIFLGIPDATHSRIRRGDKASYENVQKLAEWYGPSVYEVFGYDMVMPEDWRLRRIANIWPELSDNKQEKLLHFFDKEIMGDLHPAVA